MHSDTSSANASGDFPSTGWTLIRVVQDQAHPERPAALDRFARLYRKPVFCFLRAAGRPAPEAEDLTQEFFLHLLQGNWIHKADPQRGQFRTFLRMHLRSFLADQTSPKRVRRQKQFEREVVSLDGLAAEGDRSYEPAAGETPEQAFDRAFVRSVIQAVRQELRKRCEIEKRADDYALFTAAVPEEAGEDPMSQQALAERFCKSRDQVRGILDRMKKRARRLLHIELRDHGASEADIEAEAAELLRLLSR
jgi:RNA polymerase sigma-70 factor (ECF subfamily)